MERPSLRIRTPPPEVDEKTIIRRRHRAAKARVWVSCMGLSIFWICVAFWKANLYYLGLGFIFFCIAAQSYEEDESPEPSPVGTEAV
jgi:hypothetical protein